MFHGAHRAVHDCHALLEILAQPHPAGGTILRHLITASDRVTARIWAVNSPFDRKEDLKRRGYCWGDGSDGRPKAWWVEVDEAALEDELAFLRREIYDGDAEPIIQRLTQPSVTKRLDQNVRIISKMNDVWFHNCYYANAGCKRNIQMTPLRKVEMALPRSLGPWRGGHDGGVDERQGVLAA